MNVCRSCCLYNHIIRNILCKSIGDVLLDAAVKQHRLLAYNTDVTTQPLDIHTLYVKIVNHLKIRPAIVRTNNNSCQLFNCLWEYFYALTMRGHTFVRTEAKQSVTLTVKYGKIWYFISNKLQLELFCDDKTSSCVKHVYMCTDFVHCVISMIFTFNIIFTKIDQMNEIQPIKFLTTFPFAGS